jgi:hypothetical protein
MFRKLALLPSSRKEPNLLRPELILALPIDENYWVAHLLTDTGPASKILYSF